MPVKAAFEREIVTLNIKDIVAIKTMTAVERKTPTYRRIAASIQYVGIIKPLVVFPGGNNKYVLLDGHTRLDILITSEVASMKCLIATENEAYTYNKRANYVPPIAQHHMILRALAHVSEERIAAALNVAVATIRERRDLLMGICPETADLLRNQRITASAFCVLRKMKPVRQIDVARLMISAHKFTGRFARALLDGTPDELLVPTPKPRVRQISPREQSMMERETDELLKHVDSIRASYGDDVLNLTTACKYAERLLGNVRVRRYLGKRHADTLAAIEQLIADMAVPAANRHRHGPACRGAGSPTEGQRRDSDGLDGTGSRRARRKGHWRRGT
jgi:RepB plasmid partitioning protein/ParB-like nuclease domain